MTGDLGQRVRTLREAKGISKELLAGLAGISVSTVEQLERGTKKGSLRLSTCIRLAEALDVSVSTLIGESAA